MVSASPITASTSQATSSTTLEPSVSTIVEEETEEPGRGQNGLDLAIVPSDKTGLSKAELAGIIVGSIIGGLLLIGLIFLLCLCCCRNGSSKGQQEMCK